MNMNISKGIRFYLHYSVNGKQVREPLKDLPLVQKKDRLNYCDVKAKAEAMQAKAGPVTASAVDSVSKGKPSVDDEYKRLYGWISKGNVDDTLKGILKELVAIRMGGGHV
jgi:hypothetical protein